MRAIVPVHELETRLPEQGRIRMGIQAVGKNGKKFPKAIKRFRFTSADKRALDAIAEKYGGEVIPWPEAPTEGQWQVTVTEARIPIILPPNPLQGTPIYEAWSGGGCLRRCDGVDATLQKARDARPDAEPQVVPCPCREENRMICKPTTRLNVVLREIPFGGSWRLESHGWNTVSELPGSVALAKAVQDSQLSECYLELQYRQTEQGAKKFIVPVVGLPDSVAAIAAAQGKQIALGKVGEIREDLKAIEPPASVKDVGRDWYDEGDGDEQERGEAGTGDDGVEGDRRRDDARTDRDDGVESAGSTADGTIEDAEIIDETPPAKRRKTLSPALRALHASIGDVVELVDLDADTFRHALVRAITKGRTESSNDLDDEEQTVAVRVVADLLAGDREWIGLSDDGWARVSKHKENVE